MELILSVAAMMAEEPFKLLIVDSITANLRVDFCGRGELAERQQRLGQMMSRLRKVSCHSRQQTAASYAMLSLTLVVCGTQAKL